MRCYTHRTSDSIGICKSCGKGLCEQCVVDLGFALTCRGACEDIAKANHGLNAKAIATYAEQGKNRYFGPALFSVMGLVSMAFGLTDQPRFNYLVMMGASFLFFGVLLFFIQRRLARKLAGK